MTRLVPVISDVQAPLHDRRAVAAVATMLADNDLDSACVGDLSDQTQVSQWSRGNAGEYDGKLSADRDTAVQVMLDLRIKDLSRSNHDDRLEKYVARYSPGIGSLPELRTERFLRLDDHGVVFHRRPWPLAPGWLLMHGDEGSLSSYSGQTALGLAKKVGRSVACGHTHRAGIAHSHSTFAGRIVTPLWGLEVGHLMDMTKASYLKGGIANWQQGIGMLLIDGDDVVPMFLPIIKGKLWFDGKVYTG